MAPVGRVAAPVGRVPAPCGRVAARPSGFALQLPSVAFAPKQNAKLRRIAKPMLKRPEPQARPVTRSEAELEREAEPSYLVASTTYAAMSAICSFEIVSRYGGIAPTPFVTAASTISAEGLSVSRFGPTAPAVPASPMV